MVGKNVSASSRARVVTAVVGLALALSLTACTGSDADGSRSTASNPTATDPGAAAPSLAGAAGSSGSLTATPSSPAGTASSPTSAPRTPSGGGINRTVPSRTLATKAPVALKSTASFTSRVTAKISIAAIKAVGQGPGEVSGPALRVSFTLSNLSKSAIALNSVTADLTDSAGQPSVSMIGSPANPFRGAVAAGASRTGVYVFSVATGRRAPVTISLNYSANAPVVLFKGNAS